VTSLRSGVKLTEMIKCIVHRIKNIFSYSEEVGRLDFFITHIALVVALVVVFEIQDYFYFVWKITENTFEPNWWVLITATIPFILVVIALWANLCRRLNDLWISRWASLILFVPILNILFELYVLFATGKKK